MSISTRSDKDIEQLTGDTQWQLVARIQQLAYRINQACLADVTISQAPTTLRVVVQPYFQNNPLIDRSLSLSTGHVEGVTIALLLTRLRQVAERLQNILDAGMAPKGGAA